MNITLCELQKTTGLTESHSPFCLKTHRVLRALGLPYTSRHGDMPGTFRKLNPAAQVPVLLLDGEAIADSTEIARRLIALRPGVLRADAEAWLWEELADTALNGFLVAARWADNWPLVRAAYFGSAPKPVQWIVAPLIRRGVLKALHARDVTRSGNTWERFERLLDDLDARAPDRGYWLGAQLSIADLALFAQLQSLRTPLTTRQRTSVEKRARLTAWLDRVDQPALALRASA